MKMSVGAEILGVWVRGSLKNRWGQGKGEKSGYKTKGQITWAGLAHFAEISAPLDKRNKNQLCDYMTTESARLAGIPVLWCRNPGWKCYK